VSAVAEPREGYADPFRRYCAGCSRETGHVISAPEGLGSIDSIRWRSADPAAHTTTCLDCGQWRAQAGRAQTMFP
jgi:hypothetical protein